MAGTRLSLTDEGKTMAQEAMDRKGLTQAQLASKTYLEDVTDSISDKTVQNFLSQNAILMRYFHAICGTLELDWEVVSGRKSEDLSSEANASSSGSASATTNANSTNSPQIYQSAGVNEGFMIGTIGTFNQK